LAPPDGARQSVHFNLAKADLARIFPSSKTYSKTWLMGTAKEWSVEGKATGLPGKLIGYNRTERGKVAGLRTTLLGVSPPLCDDPGDTFCCRQLVVRQIPS
jgi:hypothetical protein